MRERYLCMVELQTQLLQLFDLCGVKSDMFEVTPMPTPLLWLEKVVQDHQLYDYLDYLNDLAKQAIEEMKDRKFEDWNNRENKRRLEELDQQLEALKKRLAQAEDDHAQAKTENERMRTEAEQLLQEQRKTVQGVITIRDHLLMKKSWIQDYMPEEVTAAKLVNDQLQETATLLEGMGVEILEDAGAFDSRYHTVVDTRPAPTPDQVDQIAETFRPGYRFRDETLRPQEVILYVNA